MLLYMFKQATYLFCFSIFFANIVSILPVLVSHVLPVLKQKCILWQFWRLEIWTSGVSRAMLPLKGFREKPSLVASRLLGVLVILWHFPACRCTTWPPPPASHALLPAGVMSLHVFFFMRTLGWEYTRVQYDFIVINYVYNGLFWVHMS